MLRLGLTSTALLLIAVHLLLTCWRLSSSWFWQDDLNLLASTAGRPLTPGLLLADYNGHLVPGSWLLAWTFDRVAPLQWWPAALSILALVAAADVAMLALLRRLFGARPAILLPLTMFCFTSLTLAATVWWAAAMQWLPAILSLLLALYFQAGYLRTGRPQDAVAAIGAVLFGLLFFEKSLTTPVVLALVTLLYGGPWLGTLRRQWGYWLGHAVLAGGFVWFYLARVTIDTARPSSTAERLALARVMVFQTLLPSLVGGPLRWFSAEGLTISSWPDPTPLLVIVAVVLSLAAVAGSLLIVPGAWRAWLLLLAFVGTSVALLAAARLGFIGPLIGRDPRYLSDVAVMAPLCLALAWLPLMPGLAAVPNVAAVANLAAVPNLNAGPEPGHGNAWSRALARGRRGWQARRLAGQARLAGLEERQAPLTAAALVAVLAMLLGGVQSGRGFMAHWSQNPTRAYVETLSRELAAHAGPVYLFGDESAPDAVMSAAFGADRRLSKLTRPMPVHPVIASTMPDLSVVDAQGHLHEGAVAGIGLQRPATICGPSGTTTVVQLSAVPTAATWKLRIGYVANLSSPARVAVGGNPPVTVQLERGLHNVYTEIRAGGSARIRVWGLDPGAAVCVGSATIGLQVAGS